MAKQVVVPTTNTNMKTTANVRVRDFFENDFKQFSVYDNERSIPRLSDGLKTSQRKCLFALVKRGENAAEIKVQQAGSYVAQVSDYHHGEGSLMSTLVGLAQNFAGSNNVNLLAPNGQFGSRLSPEAAAPRYIFTELTSAFRRLFKKDDDHILKHFDSDGMQIEPETYMPILPMVLVNGGSGTGTGFACSIMSYHPLQLRDNIQLRLQNKEAAPLVPWYNGFNGTVDRVEKQTVIKGKFEIVNSVTIRVTELPIGTYLDDYIAQLIKLEDAGFIRSWEDSSTEKQFDFLLSVPRSTTALPEDELMQKLKLISRDTENLTLWDVNGKMRKFDTVQDMIDRFIEWRLERYEERRIKLIDINEKELVWLNEKLRFILFYLANTDKFKNSGKKILIDLLEAEKFTDPSRLLSMSIWSLTHDEIKKLEKEIIAVENELKRLKKLTPKAMYQLELKELAIDGIA